MTAFGVADGSWVFAGMLSLLLEWSHSYSTFVLHVFAAGCLSNQRAAILLRMHKQDRLVKSTEETAASETILTIIHLPIQVPAQGTPLVSQGSADAYILRT